MSCDDPEPKPTARKIAEHVAYSIQTLRYVREADMGNLSARDGYIDWLEQEVKEILEKP